MRFSSKISESAIHVFSIENESYQLSYAINLPGPIPQGSYMSSLWWSPNEDKIFTIISIPTDKPLENNETLWSYTISANTWEEIGELGSRIVGKVYFINDIGFFCQGVSGGSDGFSAVRIGEEITPIDGFWIDVQNCSINDLVILDENHVSLYYSERGNIVNVRIDLLDFSVEEIEVIEISNAEKVTRIDH